MGGPEPSEEDLALWRSRDDWGELSCRDFVGLVTDYFDECLPPADLERFKYHLTVCPACLEHLRQMQLTIEATGLLREDDVSPLMLNTVLQEFRKWERRAMTGKPLDEADSLLVAQLRAGDEQAFELLVQRHHTQLVSIAGGHLSSIAAAEEVAQETWFSVLRGIDRFEGRSSLKTWIFRILLNKARSEGHRQRREIATNFAESLDGLIPDHAFHPATSAGFAGWWAHYPSHWAGLPEARAEAGELRAAVCVAIAAIPPGQRDVIILRDVERFTSAETCELLGISEGNQRVLLHRARSRVRHALEHHLGDRS